MSKSIAWVKFKEESKNHGQFVAEPLEKGFGVTLGNSLRRVLLSSLPGAAVTSVNIEGVKHEFSTIEGVKEDVLDVLLNIKGLVLRSHSKEPKTIRINAKAAGEITARDIEHDAEIEIVNPDHHIATLNKGASLKAEMIVEQGKGYLSTEIRTKEDRPIGTILIDAVFSPIVKVNHHVEPTRVGKLIDYDKLVLDVWTNGSLSPEDAVKMSSKILITQMNLFLSLNEKPKEGEDAKGLENPTDKKKAAGLELTIDDLELSARSSNCLKKAGIETVAELVSRPLRDLMTIKNFGKKSADEINAKLAQYNLSLKQEEGDELLLVDDSDEVEE